jgi:hypothetical protein
MKIRISHIADRGVANRECLHLEAISDTNLNYYAVFSTMLSEGGGVIAIPKRVYWFTDHRVKPGDTVVLYTGPGVNSSRNQADGTTMHVFYWGNKETIWNSARDCAVVIEINDWSTVLPP